MTRLADSDSSPSFRKMPSKERPSAATRSKKKVIPGRGSRKVRGATTLTIELAATRAIERSSCSLVAGRIAL